MFECNQIIVTRLMHSTQTVKFKFMLGSIETLFQCLCSPNENIFRFESIRVYNYKLKRLLDCYYIFVIRSDFDKLSALHTI